MSKVIMVKELDGAIVGYSSKYYQVNEITGDVERISDKKVVFQSIKG